MNIAYIRNTIRQIKVMSADYEAAHGLEDTLYEEFIKYIAKENYGELSKMAEEVLKTKKVDFSRYCA